MEKHFSNYDKGTNLFSFELPTTKRILTWSMPTHIDEMNLEEEIEALKKVYNKEDSVDKSSSTRLKHLIKSVDGKLDRKYINEFVDNEFLSVDSLAFRTHITKETPDIDFTINVKNSQGEKEKVAVPMTADFFWPNTRV